MNSQRTIRVIRPTSEITTESSKIRVAAYCRVSSDSDSQEDSFLAQVKHYSDYIRSKDNMELVDIYADEGITGTEMSKRDEFLRMLNDAKLGRIDRLFCKSISRFARNSLECIECIRVLKEYGVTVLFENDNVDTKTMSSEMVLYVKSAFAQSEALAGSSRMASAYRMKMENGTFITCCAPYGYKLIDGNLVVNQEEAETVRKIFEMYLSGKGINTISAVLNRDAIEFGGRQWCNRTVRYVLTNEKYIGDSLTQKTYTPRTIPFRKAINNGERDKFYVSNTHEAIISREDYCKVQEILTSRKNINEQRRKRYIFSQMIICSNCGRAFRRNIQNNVIYWVCSKKGTSGFACNTRYYTEEALEKGFIKAYNKLQAFKQEILNKTITDLLGLQAKRIKGNEEIRQIDNEVIRLSEQNNRLEALRGKGILDVVSFTEQTNRLRGRLAELRNRRRKLLQNFEEDKVIEELSSLKDYLDIYPSAVIDFQSEIFTTIIEKIIAESDGTVSFIIKGGIKLNELIMEEI